MVAAVATGLARITQDGLPLAGPDLVSFKPPSRNGSGARSCLPSAPHTKGVCCGIVNGRLCMAKEASGNACTVLAAAAADRNAPLGNIQQTTRRGCSSIAHGCCSLGCKRRGGSGRGMMCSVAAGRVVEHSSGTAGQWQRHDVLCSRWESCRALFWHSRAGWEPACHGPQRCQRRQHHGTGRWHLV
jgi:hypothetical protein